MTIFQSIILGIVEGLTEFLPVSSTGHLIIVSELLGIAESEFTKSFNIIIQLGAILAVVLIYWSTLVSNKELLKKTVVAFVPTAILGAALYSSIKDVLGNSAVVAWSLIIGGIILIAFEWWYIRKHIDRLSVEDAAQPTEIAQEITLKKAAIIGIVQALAFIPGVSRSGATIVGGQLLGLTRKSIVEFSFILAVPTMLAASGLDIIQQAHTFTVQNIEVLAIGFIVSFIVAFFAIKSFLKFVQHHSFVVFGIYRIIVGLLFLFFVL